ncbi:DUF967 domain protein [Colletotrichum truncatum]|uniref:DUF967 domain protein n=1 Tax=Colletotrichum truncatum TaxID=5467 RepID=A0ACC3YVF0_COLTU
MPPGRPKFDLDPYKGEIIEAWNRRETIESMIKSLAAKGIEVNSKTFQRRLREWGLFRYNKVKNTTTTTTTTPQQRRNTRPSIVGSGGTLETPATATSLTQQPILLQSMAQEIPDSLQEDSPSSTPSVSIADSSPERNDLVFESQTLRAQSSPRPQPQPQPQPQQQPAVMSQKVWTRRNPAGFGLEKSLEAVRNPGAAPVPIPLPPSDMDEIKQECDSFTLSSFTAEDAFELGHFLHARLLPFALVNKKPTVVSIALANGGGQVLFQTAVGSGTLADNETWVQRKRNSVLRWGSSTWWLHNKFAGDEVRFAALFGMGAEQAGKYAIHGGGVPIRVQGVEGVVAVVVVSGLKQDQDHGVIVDVIKNNWQ